ncbi:MAG: hypothetical protein PHE59_03280 [Patescibacteria group bacterium]|nr:hypothetical protein [Patescibacteria group bacterium]MDD5164852.1 hypothetical protein [Patescibacteria group bacterium]MDD5534684.1 hypothetical protein [Patescibacteria group bacterium]
MTVKERWRRNTIMTYAIIIAGIICIFFIAGIFSGCSNSNENKTFNTAQEIAVVNPYTIEKIDENIIILRLTSEWDVSIENWKKGIKEVATKYQILSMAPIATEAGYVESTYSPTIAIIMVVKPKNEKNEF